MDKVKVSVILPIYCGEKYLKKSLESLVNQTLKEIEIICVNDGSTDNTLEILKEYKENNKDKNIIIVNKKNEGIFRARIDGINKARGEYIGFLDCDDYIELDFFEKMYNLAKKEKARNCRLWLL